MNKLDDINHKKNNQYRDEETGCDTHFLLLPLNFTKITDIVTLTI